MKRFTSTPTPDKNRRQATRRKTVTWAHDGQSHTVTIPSGYQYRPGTRLPGIAVALIDLLGPTYALEDVSAAHDYAYDLRERGEWEHSRAAADAALLADEDDPRWLAYAAWGVVRAVGWVVW